MKCKICGANLKKEGDICKNCYNEYKEYEELAKDNENEHLTLKMKYSFWFSFVKLGEIFLLLLIAVLAGFNYYNAVIGSLITVLTLVIYSFCFYYLKKRAENTKVTFFETKMKYTSKYLFFNKEEVIKYEDITDIAFFKTFSQKLFNTGDIRIYTKGFLSGLTIADVPDLKDNFEKIREIINNSR